MNTNKKIALFIDCENVSHKHIENIIEELASYGEVNIRKAYGDWKHPTLNAWNDKLFDYSLEAMHQPPYSTNKNATDIKMTVDIMKILCQSDNIDYVALATSDSDFTPLVTEIKSQGIQVLGFGEEKTSKILQKACTEFVTLNKQENMNDIKNNQKLINLLKKAIEYTCDDNGRALVVKVGSYIKNKTSEQAKNYGNYKKWGAVFKDLDNVFKITYKNNGDTMLVENK